MAVERRPLERGAAMLLFRLKAKDASSLSGAPEILHMSIARQQLGIRGERVAERWLNVHGWEIAERRFRTGHRDIDLIATRAAAGSERIVAFVEVKTRKTNAFGGPVGAVSWRKQRELIRSAKVWIARHQKPSDTFRFDVIGVILGTETVRVQHVENAFNVPSSPNDTRVSGAGKRFL